MECQRGRAGWRVLYARPGSLDQCTTWQARWSMLSGKAKHQHLIACCGVWKMR
jgi:hypothetical protein